VNDPFRWCVYCEADCYEDDPRHDDDCPSLTGLYPIDGAEFWPHGPVACIECGEPFAPGDHYVLRDVESGLITPRPAIGEVTCLGCAALQPELG
jgi:hypothetical protein